MAGAVALACAVPVGATAQDPWTAIAAEALVPLERDILLMAVPDEEVGGALGAAWMREKHYAELDPEYILDEGGMGSRDLFAAGKLVFGISVADKKMLFRLIIPGRTACRPARR
jgi:acetylornithine deacetylase/succinyl-diaminopimelate desuccinylase-like protein